MKLYSKVRTPCIGVCSTGLGDSVCRGCKRFEHEVIDWNSYSMPQKWAIDNRLAHLLKQVVSSHLTLVDEALLLQQMQLQQIRFSEHRCGYCALFELLRAGASQINDFSEYGFSINKVSERLSLIQIRDAIDKEFYQLSVAHFERYIVANQYRAKCIT